MNTEQIILQLRKKLLFFWNPIDILRKIVDILCEQKAVTFTLSRIFLYLLFHTRVWIWVCTAVLGKTSIKYWKIFQFLVYWKTFLLSILWGNPSPIPEMISRKVRQGLRGRVRDIDALGCFEISAERVVAVCWGHSWRLCWTRILFVRGSCDCPNSAGL